LWGGLDWAPVWAAPQPHCRGDAAQSNFGPRRRWAWASSTRSMCSSCSFTWVRTLRAQCLLRGEGVAPGRGHHAGCNSLLCCAGTTRLQLKNKGDTGQMTDFANIIVAFAFLGVPVIGWLLDKKVRTSGRWPTCLASLSTLGAPLTQRLYRWLCIAGLWHHPGDHQRAEPGQQHPPGHSKPSSPGAYADHLDGQSFLHVLQVRLMKWLRQSPQQHGAVG